MTYISRKKLTPKETLIVDAMAKFTYKNGTVEKISDARTKNLQAIAYKQGCDDKQAKRLAAHFNAMTNIVNNKMSDRERARYRAALKNQFG